MSKKKAKQGSFPDVMCPAATSVRNVLKSGFLLKEGGSYRSWKSRYFVLDGYQNVLFYYAKAKGKKPLGFIPLWHCTVEPSADRGYPCCLEISHPERRTYFVIADKDQFNEWLVVLRKVASEGRKEHDLMVRRTMHSNKLIPNPTITHH